MNDLPEPLLAYFAERENQRAAAVETFLASLTDYERGLVHDAAVMGYVQGLMRDREEGAPKDSQTMALVIDACLAMPDLYPAVNAEFEERRTTVEYYAQTQQPDGTWVDSSGRTTVLEAAESLLAGVRRRVPDAEHRLARRTTSVIVEAQQNGAEP
ncbi:hypothetical protein ACFY2M_19275 [Streptomyces sp. NPDC001276]|uniref:hypothetical protein n=1 Tax=Streptomyces sp. NPDC001276 TaxID=3364555 RepID=UPI0036A0F4E0